MNGNLLSLIAAVVVVAVGVPIGVDSSVLEVEPELPREDVIATMKPFDGKSFSGTDRSTLVGKVMCGYQGWFAAESDGFGRGWSHYGVQKQFEPGACGIDLWPDLSEFDEDEKFSTPFRHSDGRAAQLFSSNNRKTVLRHFQWMKEYGVDGVFVQRFAGETIGPRNLRHCNAVLDNCREGANLHGRTYAVMYDLTGLPAGGLQVVIDDWKLLIDRTHLGKDPNDSAYQHHHGKPVVAVWGIGFDEGRLYDLPECEYLIEFMKNDPKYGGFTVIVGVPSGWRTLDSDSVKDPVLHRVLNKADIISPWTIGRYATLAGVESHATRRWKGDVDWCRTHGKDYLPVVFPGYSWHNSNPAFPLDQIPRQQGKFLWKQFVEARKAGASMAYVAMFDELNEATAILKCTSDVPTGSSPFLTFDGLPSDHYLWLTGKGREMLNGQIRPSTEPPPRTTGAVDLLSMRHRTTVSEASPNMPISGP